MKNRQDAAHVGYKRRPILKNLPDWFRLNNYEAVRGLDALGWLQQIYVRQACYSQLKDMRSEEPILPEWNDAVRKALSNSRRQPICGSTYAPFNGKELSWCFDIPSEQEGGGPVIREMKLLDLYKLERNARLRWNLSKEQIQEAEHLMSHQSVFRFLHPPAWMNTAVTHEESISSIIPLIIDLSFPNAVLIEHFTLHLQRLRRVLRGKSTDATRQTPELTKWAEAGLLPCMDLILWVEEEQGRMTDSLLADAVSPKGYADEERMRKTIRPLAEELLSPGIKGEKAFRRWENSGDLQELLKYRGIDGLEILQRLKAYAYSDLVQRQQVRERRARKKSPATGTT